MIFRGILTGLVLAVLLSACAGGSGRQGTEIVVSASGPTTPVQSGAQAVFVMTVTNTGPYDASNISLVDTVGNQLKLISITCTASGGATCPSTPAVQMSIPTLPNGGALAFSVTLELASGATGIVSNSMHATYAEEIDASSLSATASATAVTSSAALVVSGTGPTQTLTGGSQAVFVMTVTNSGPDAAGAFTVRENPGNGLTLVSITCTPSGGATCPTAPVTASSAITGLPVGGVLTFTVTTQLAQNINGTINNTLSVTGAGSGTNTSFTVSANVASAILSVTGTPPAGPLADGSTGNFTVVVTNNGPGTAQSITIANALSTGLTGGTVTCVAFNGATCPASSGLTTTVDSLVSGGTLTFTVPVTVNAGTSGTTTDTVTVSSATDPKGTHTDTLNLVTGNPANGTYQLFASNGKQYTMTIDFDTGTYTITGNNQTLNQTFTADATGGGYTVSGTARFRVATKLIVGGQDFGSGVMPYIAVLQLGTTVQQLYATYDFVTLDLPVGGGNPTTVASTGRVTGNTLQICSSTSGIAAPQACGNVTGAGLQSYSLTVSSNVYTATNTGGGTSFTFMTGISGAAAYILSAGTAPDGSQQLLIGIPDSAGIAGGTTIGPSNFHGDWVTIVLSATSYAYTGQSGGSDTATLHSINSAGGPFSLVTGNLASNGAGIDVMQAYPLTITFGAAGGAASGLLQLTVP